MSRFAQTVNETPTEEQVPLENETSSFEKLSKDNTDLLMELLEYIEDSSKPSISLIQQWKANYPAVYFSTIIGDDLYIWRPIMRQEYKQMMIQYMESDSMNQFMLEEQYVKKCLLYPKLELGTLATKEAGVISTLSDQILYKSGFMNKELAYTLIKKL